MTASPALHIRKVHRDNGVSMWHGQPTAQARRTFYREREATLLSIPKRNPWQEMALRITRERIDLLRGL